MTPNLGNSPNHVSSNHSNDSVQTLKQDREMAVDKKLAKKLAKMSEEDRAVFLEQQRLAEEENQRKKEEMLSRFLKVGGVWALESDSETTSCSLCSAHAHRLPLATWTTHMCTQPH